MKELINLRLESKKRFRRLFDPEPEVFEPIIITQDNQRTKTSNKKIISLNPVTNPQITTVPSQPTPPDFTTIKVKELRQYIKQFNLQSKIQESCSKPISKCRKAELIQALS